MKRYVLIAGLLVLFSLAAGCSLGGGNDESDRLPKPRCSKSLTPR